jgi:hypothetical protein
MRTDEDRAGQVTQISRTPATRRAHFRYPLRISVSYRWTNGQVVNRSKGVARDISEEGAFVVTPDCPPMKEVVDLVFRMPRLRKPVAVPEMQIAMEGRVVRVEHDPVLQVNVGFAVRSRKASRAEEGPIQDAAWLSGTSVGSPTN